MSYRLKVESSIFERFPEYMAIAIYAYELDNESKHEYATNVLRQAEALSREMFGMQKPSGHPHIAAWRTASSFWIKAE
jgi:DNA/RNA-binding domain of Phe-tRNA-synthetase-like protein